MFNKQIVSSFVELLEESLRPKKKRAVIITLQEDYSGPEIAEKTLINKSGNYIIQRHQRTSSVHCHARPVRSPANDERLKLLTKCNRKLIIIVNGD